MRVLFSAASELLTDHEPHGEGLICHGILTHLARRGLDLVAFTPRAALRHPLEGGTRVLIPPSSTPFASLRWWRYQWESRRLARSALVGHVDVVNHAMPFYIDTHFSLVDVAPLVVGPMFLPWPAGEPMLDAPMRSRRRFGRAGQLTKAILASLDRHLYLRTLARSARILVTVERLRPLLPPEVREKALVVPGGVNCEEFRPAENAGDSGPQILFLANLIKRKGLEYLLQAMPEVLRHEPRATLVVAGGGPNEAALRESVAALHLGEHVSFLGPVSHDAACAVFQSCAVYCLPSLGEPFGVTLLEAMACGKPVVATASGGVPEIVVDERSGFLVPRADSPALARALVRLLADPPLRRTMGQFNRQRCEEVFDWSRVSKTLEDVYTEVAA